MLVIKRNGKEVEFDINKIINAITQANKEYLELTPQQINEVANKVLLKCKKLNRAVNVEEIQDLVEDALIKINAYNVSKHYIKYRYQKELERKQNTTDAKILSTVNLENEEVKQENSNKNPTIIPTQRDYIAGLVSRDLTERYLLPKDVAEAHRQGLIHFHDSDYFITKNYNCCLVNLEDMLQNGTVINSTLIEKPHTFTTACNIATQIMAQVASNQYGGQTITLTHLAPFVQRSRERIAGEIKEEFDLLESPSNLTAKQFNDLVELRVKREIKRGVQIMQYQINTLMTTNGQTPFVSVSMYLNEAKEPQLKHDLALIIEEVLNQRIQGTKNEAGAWVTPTFPKLLYVLEPDNIEEGQTYYYLTKLAAKCTAKRMVPDYISEKILLENKYGISNSTGEIIPEEAEAFKSYMKKIGYSDEEINRQIKNPTYIENDWLHDPEYRKKNMIAWAPMGCRSFLTPYFDKEKEKPTYAGRFNQGVCTVNLVDIACSSKKNTDKFWKIFDERLELCHKALRVKHERLKGTPSDVAPILWQHGAIARLRKGETIDKLLYGGYSTISLGYAGLWETVYYMTGKKLTEEEGQSFGLEIMHKLNEYTNKWKAAENIDYSLYGTPMESTVAKFIRCLQERFGIIEGVTDKQYITNSYHIHVTEKIDAFTKLAIESKFQKLSPGGAISYVEVPNMQDNIEAVLSIIKFIYNNIQYAELNTKSDYCMCCNYDGEIEIVKDKNGKLVWECPNCGNRDQTKMSVVRRTCGYLGSQYWNQARTNEISERALHLGEPLLNITK